MLKFSHAESKTTRVLENIETTKAELEKFKKLKEEFEKNPKLSINTEILKTFPLSLSYLPAAAIEAIQKIYPDNLQRALKEGSYAFGRVWNQLNSTQDEEIQQKWDTLTASETNLVIANTVDALNKTIKNLSNEIILLNKKLQTLTESNPDNGIVSSPQTSSLSHN